MSDMSATPNVYLTKLIGGETYYTQTAINFFNERIKELERKLAEMTESYERCFGKFLEKDRMLVIAVETLTLVAFLDEPAADSSEYWKLVNQKVTSRIHETMAFDTRICREALENIKHGSEVV